MTKPDPKNMTPKQIKEERQLIKQQRSHIKNVAKPAAQRKAHTEYEQERGGRL